MEKEKTDSVLDPKPVENQTMQTNNPTSVMRKFDSGAHTKIGNPKAKNSIIYGVMGIVVVLAGVGTGYLLSGGINANEIAQDETLKTDLKGEAQEAGEVKSEDVQEVVGTLVEGGVEGEGTHTLDRGLGPQKNVTLFSTSLNLDNFVGKKVTVWGETVSSENSSWLMDVNKIKVTN